MRAWPLALLLALTACATERPPDLLAPVYFYHGHSIGKESLTTGLQISRDDGATFACAAWPELISSSVAVDASGRYVYLACGNGVMISRDAGRNWRLTGGITLMEVQRLVIDPDDPHRVWAVSAYGLFLAEDVWGPGNPWRQVSRGSDFRHCTDLLVDGRKLWVAAHRGLFTSDDGGESFEARFTGAPVRRMVRDGDGTLWIVTDGMGVRRGFGEGDEFDHIEGSPDVGLCIAFDPRAPRTLYVGGLEGVSVSTNAGATWTTSRAGLPDEYAVYGLLPHPTTPGRVLISGNDGVFESVDHGRTWRRVGFENAMIPDLAAARLADVEPRPASSAPGALEITESPARATPEASEEFANRRKALLDRLRERRPAEGRSWSGFFRGAITVRDGEASPAFWRELLEALEKPKTSMFFSMPLIGFALHSRGSLPPEVENRIREVMITNPVYRGDTENHWTMHYAVQLLAAETWPETPASVWPTGQTTQEVHDEAKRWLVHWARLAATRGQGEFDSPNYMLMYVMPMLLLNDFARDDEVRRLGGMMLDLLLADYLAESLRGAWCGGHSRIIGKEVEKTTGNRVAFLHHLYAGGIEIPESVHGWAAFAALSSYRPPEMFEAIANRRAEPYTHTEVKRVRNVIRYGRDLNPPVHKTTWMSPRCALGSLHGGILQPIQQHTWDVTWIGGAENSTVFTVHPSISARELAMFFPEEINGLVRTITGQKGVYSSPDKLISASEFERVSQHENVLLAFYKVPEKARFPYVTMYVPHHLELGEENGWTFGRDGDFYMAWFATGEGRRIEREAHDEYRYDAGTIGFVFVVRRTEHESFVQFRREILARPRPFFTAAKAITGLRWGEHEVATPSEHLAPFPKEYLYRGPFVNSRVGTGIIEMTDGQTSRRLDFNDFTVTEEGR